MRIAEVFVSYSRVTRADQDGQPHGRSRALDSADDRIDMPVPMDRRDTLGRG
jgi:hypothetical protein